MRIEWMMFSILIVVCSISDAPKSPVLSVRTQGWGISGYVLAKLKLCR